MSLRDSPKKDWLNYWGRELNKLMNKYWICWRVFPISRSSRKLCWTI